MEKASERERSRQLKPQWLGYPTDVRGELDGKNSKRNIYQHRMATVGPLETQRFTQQTHASSGAAVGTHHCRFKNAIVQYLSEH